MGEVLSLELPRLSINGWFHGPALAPAPAPAAPPIATPPHQRTVSYPSYEVRVNEGQCWDRLDVLG